MSLRRYSIVLGVIILVAAVSVTGYASVETASPQMQAPSEDRPSEEVIEQHALSNKTTVESVTGTVTIESEIQNRTQTIQADVWQEPPNKVRFKYTAGPPEGNVMVSNGSTVWFYNNTTNTVRRLQYETGLIQNLSQAFQDLSEQYTAEYQGQAMVSGQETYVVLIKPPNGTVGGVVSNQTVWLDQENWFPVKSQITTTVRNQTSTTTVMYSNLTYNTSIPADRFTFEPPENATVVDTELPQTMTFDSVEAAENAVNFSIREPQSLPDGYQLKNVTVTQAGNTTSVSLIYGNESETLRFSQSTADQSTMRGRDVSVAGHAGSYQKFGGQSALQWQSEGFTYSVSGPVSQSTLIEIAESLYC